MITSQFFVLGIDPLLWQQGVADNPDPARLIPYPVVGFAGLRERQKMQKIEIETHDACLKVRFKLFRPFWIACRLILFRGLLLCRNWLRG